MLGMATHRILHKTEPGKLKMELTDKKGNNTGEILFILQASGGRFAQQSGNTSSTKGIGSGTGTAAGYGSGTGTGVGHSSSGAGLTGAAAGLAGASGDIGLCINIFSHQSNHSADADIHLLCRPQHRL